VLSVSYNLKVKKMPPKLIICLTLLFTAVSANIVELNGFRLLPFVMVKKQDFTYSSGASDEDFSAIKFELQLQPVNTNATQDYALMIITADVDMSNKLVNLLTNGTQQASPSDTGVKQQEI